MLAPAPKASLGAAEIRLVDVATSEDIRTLRLRVIWPFEADRTYVFLRSDGAVRSISTGGHTVKPVGGGRESDPDITLLYFAPPAEGLELTVSLAGDAPLEVEVVGHLPGLPVFADLPTVRPPHLMPREGWSSDSTYVRSVARFETAPRMPAQQ